MARTNLRRIEKLLKDEKTEVVKIDEELDVIKHELVIREPSDFSFKDIARSFFGALIVAFSFIFAGEMVTTAVRMNNGNVIAVMSCSIITLIFEIYYFGYRKVENKHERKFGQFMMKRLPTFYLITVIVSVGLVFLYGVNNTPVIASSSDVFKVIVVISFPASLGAGMSDLLKKYGP